jgi:hypothetical protein
MEKAVEILFKLEERYDFFRRLRGDKWQESVDAYEPYIRKHMAAKKCNEIEAALALGKLLSDGGHDPNELFAVAVHMVKHPANTNRGGTGEAS